MPLVNLQRDGKMLLTEEQKFFPKTEVELLMLFEKQFQGLLCWSIG